LEADDAVAAPVARHRARRRHRAARGAPRRVAVAPVACEQPRHAVASSRACAGSGARRAARARGLRPLRAPRARRVRSDRADRGVRARRHRCGRDRRDHDAIGPRDRRLAARLERRRRSASPRCAPPWPNPGPRRKRGLDRRRQRDARVARALCIRLSAGDRGVACRLTGASPAFDRGSARVAVRGDAVVVAKPEVGYDASAMHLQFAELVAANHRWPFDAARYAWAVMPMGADAAYLAAYLVDGERAARLVNLLFGALLCAATYTMMRMQADRVVALASVCALASTPLWFLESGSLFV